MSGNNTFSLFVHLCDLNTIPSRNDVPVSSGDLRLRSEQRGLGMRQRDLLVDSEGGRDGRHRMHLRGDQVQRRYAAENRFRECTPFIVVDFQGM